MRGSSRPGFVASVTGATILLELVIGGLLFTADREMVRLAGFPLEVKCAFKARFGVPCPACGMTRSLVLTLHGDIATAAELNLGGPIAIFGMLGFAAAMLWLGWRQRRRPDDQLEVAQNRIRWVTAASGLALIAIVCAHWVRQLV
jgi:hypothetical protein